jgi:hypothetical protein
MAARAVFFSLALGPHPQRELSLMLRLGFPRPRRRTAAGAPYPAHPTHLPFLPFLPLKTPSHT